jgi:cyclopropane fatty-acyl-phospholipid synthase-like methyltransferase
MRTPTDWNNYKDNPDSFLSKHFHHNYILKAYSDLLKNIDFENPIEILEFGSGTVSIDKWICQRYKVKKVTLIDFNKRMLNIGKNNLSKILCETEFINIDFFNFEPDKQYDIVHSQGVIEHFEPEKRYELLKRHCDATKTGGYCIIYSPTPSKPYLFFRKIYELSGIWIFSDEVPLESKIIVEEMKSLGFTAIKSNVFWKYFLTEIGIIFNRNVSERTKSNKWV